MGKDFKKDFKDVIGYENVKEELYHIIDYLENRKKYDDLGVTMPAGLLLWGEAGVGKTTMCNSFIKSCSDRKTYVIRKDIPNGDFVKYIKEVFTNAKKDAPSIVFLDDFDKFANDDEGHKNSQEFVTLQTCIDGAKGSDVFVLATANSIRNIPSSLLREGRFDKVIEIINPIGEDAIKIVDHYLKKKKNVEGIDANEVGRILSGYSCAALEKIINEAGLMAGFEGSEKILKKHIINSIIKTMFSGPRRRRPGGKNSAERVCTHEVGHLLVQEVLNPGSVNFISISSNCSTIGGMVAVKPAEVITRKTIEERIITSLGGKAALEVVMNDTDIGCNQDLHDAFDSAIRLVDDIGADGFHHWQQQEYISDGMMAKREQAMESIVNESYRKAKTIIFENRKLFDAIYKEVLKKETLTFVDIKEIREKVGL